MLKCSDKSNKYAVFFDLDGTLIDSEPITELVVANWIKKTTPNGKYSFGVIAWNHLV